MNLHGIVAPAIGAVNPFIVGTVKVSTGSVIGADYTNTPTYQSFPGQQFQVQAATGPALRQIDGLNLQGIVRVVYLNGNIEGLDRPAGKGGDLLVFNGQTWLVEAVLEPWDNVGWTKVAVVLQEG